MNQQKPLKIAIVTNNYTPYSGGVVSSIVSFTDNLRALGHKVYIITLDFTHNLVPQENIFRVKCPLKFTYKNNPLAVPIWPDKTVLSILKEIKPDIIHTHHPFLLGISGLKAGNKLSIPVVFTYHTRYEEYLHYIPFPEVFTHPIVKGLAISYCNKVNGIVAPSLSTFDFLKENVKKPIKVIPSGLLPIFSPQEFKVKEANNPFHLLTVSRFAKEKNIKFLLDVFAKLNCQEYIFTLIGYGAFLPELQNYAYEKLKLCKDKVKFIVKPPKDLIASYYRQSDLFVFSSLTETQGLVLAESMAGGTPIVALEATGSSDIIKDGINGYLVNTVDQMTQRIKELADDDKLHKQMQHQAWLTSQTYNPLNTTNSLINFYNNILGL